MTVPAADEVIDRARELVPVLRERSAQCEELRRIPEASVRDLVALGIPRISQPTRFGGMGLGLGTIAEVGFEIGRGCGSTAWMAVQWPGHNFMAGMFHEQAQGEYWADSVDVLSSTASAFVSGDFEPTGDGIRVSGTWKFSSGVDEAQWVFLSTPENLCLVPRSDFRIVDDWFVSGLCGSGSKSIVIEDAIVPAHRMIDIRNFASGINVGSELYGPQYGIPFAVWAPSMLASAVVGMAQGVVDLFEMRVQSRMDHQTMSPASSRPGTQLRFAESTAEVDMARLAIRTCISEAMSAAGEPEGLSLAERARHRRDVTFAVKLCSRAVDRLIESGDASAIYTAQPIQRTVRDLRAASLQMSLTWDEPALLYSRVRWGIPPESVVV